MKEFNTCIKNYRATVDGDIYWEYEIYDAENNQTVFEKGGFESLDEAKTSLGVALDNLQHPERLKWEMNDDGTAKRLSEDGGTRELIVATKYTVTYRRNDLNSCHDSNWATFNTEQEAFDFIRNYVTDMNRVD